MSYIKRLPYTRKPPSGVKPDLGHPQLKGCIGFWAHNYQFGSHNLVPGPFERGTGNGTIDQIADYFGFVAASDEWIRLGSPILGMTAGYSIIARIESNTSSRAQIFSSAETGVQHFQFALESTSSVVKLKQWPANDETFGVTDVTDGQWHTVGVTWDSIAQRAYIYVDGKDDTEATPPTISSQTDAGTGNYYIGGKKASGGDSFNGRMDYVKFFNRALSSIEHKEIHNNPWAPFTRPLPIWIPAAAAGGNAITSTLATLSITPLASSINDKTEVTSSLAALSITGLQSSINDKTEIISGTFGSLPLTALQSSVNDKTQVASTLANLPINAFQSSVSQGTDVTSTLGVLSITTLQSSINDKTQVASTLADLPIAVYQSVVAQAGDQNITSSLGQLTITTFTSAVNDKTEVTSSLGSLNLQSFASLVNDKTQVASTLADLPITTYQSTVTTAANIVSTLATLPITVFQSKVGQPTDITSTLATLSITPLASTIVDVTKVETGNVPNLPLLARQSIVAGEGAGGDGAQRSINSGWRRRRSH